MPCSTKSRVSNPCPRVHDCLRQHFWGDSMTEPGTAEIDEIVPEAYDLVVLGSGEGSKFVAWTLAKQGQRVAVVERKWIGGSCPNIACLPSKNFIHSAKVASYFKRAAEFGITNSGYTIDMAAVRDRKRTMVKELVDVHLRNFQSSGAELVLGDGTLIGPNLVQVDMQDGTMRKLRGKNVLIGTGTRAHLDDIPGLERLETTAQGTWAIG